MFVRLLALFLVVFHTWLLTLVKSDYHQHYKLNLAHKASKKQNADEQCGSISLNVPALQHYLPAGMPGQLSRLIPEMACCSTRSTSDTTHKRHDRPPTGRHVQDKLDDVPSQEIKMEKSLQAKISSEPDSRDGDKMNSISKQHRTWKHSTSKHLLDLSDLQSALRITGKVRTVSGPTKLQVLKTRSTSKDNPPLGRRVRRSAVKFTTEVNKYWEEGREDFSKEANDKSAKFWRSRIQNVPPNWMMALYFSGQRERLQSNPAERVELPRSSFTLELWVKPEGGQNNPAIIAG